MAKKTKKTPRAGKTSAPPRTAAAAPPAVTMIAVAAPAAATNPAPAAPAAPTQAAISARAHALWIARGKPIPGTPLADWLEAERELNARKP
jgi:hypothetical protein